METLEIFLSAVEDKGVWYVEGRVGKGETWREKVQNENTPNTEEAALDLVQQTKRYIQHIIMSTGRFEASA